MSAEKYDQILKRIDKGSSPSQKQRHALFELWYALKEKGIEMEELAGRPFEFVYNEYMEAVIDGLKLRIDFVLKNDKDTINAAIDGNGCAFDVKNSLHDLRYV